MKPAVTSKRYFSNTRMMVISGHNITHRHAGDLASLLDRGDLLLVNAVSTLPASFSGVIQRSREKVELRLAAFRGERADDLRLWSAVAFGSGTWREPTEKRGPAPDLKLGDEIEIAAGLKARVLELSSHSSRLLRLEFVSERLLENLFKHGRPIQYSYHQADLALWDQQTLFQGPPLAVEPPSASFPLSWGLVLKLKSKGVKIMPLLHSAGISSTGDANLDKLLPLEEFYSIPESTWQAIQSSKGRVIALGTSVTRAVESAAHFGKLSGLTDLKLGRDSRVQFIDTLVTGMHDEGTSHAELMKAFCNEATLREANRQAEDLGYLSHEYGDLTLITRPA